MNAFNIRIVICLAAIAPLASRATASDARFEARVLHEKTQNLRLVLESQPISPIAIRTACELDERVARLCERIACPHEVAELSCAIEDVNASTQQLALVVDRICALRDNPLIRREVECVLRQVARTNASVQVLIASQGVAVSPGYLSAQVAPQQPTGPVYRSSIPFPGARIALESPADLARVQRELLLRREAMERQRLVEQRAAEARRAHFAPTATPWDAARAPNYPAPAIGGTERPGLALMSLILSELSR